MQIKLKKRNAYDISENLYGIFLEDINFAVDGGLNANMVENYSFDGVYMDKNAKTSLFDPLRYWNAECGRLFSGNENPLSENSFYATIRCPKEDKSNMFWKSYETEEESFFGGKACISNLGFNGHKKNEGKGAMSIQKGESYFFGAYFRNRNFDGNVTISVVSDDEITLAKSKPFFAKNTEWERLSFVFDGQSNGYGRLKITLEGRGDLDIDCVEFRKTDVWGCDDPKWRHGKFRKDIVEALKSLSPSFLRFPGGCIVEGDYLGNRYNWKETVGELYERKSKYNVWSESLENGGYNRSFQIGFYEYLCLCEDLSMKPLPTLWCGLNCRCRANTRREPCTGYEIGSPEFQTEVIDSYLDLIEFCNGDPQKSKWAKLRLEMGHPKPFGLDRIGIGNENYADEYFSRYRVIKNAINSRYPEIKCILSAGPSPDVDRMAPAWEFAKKNSNDSIIDEHSYETPKWFFERVNRFDSYDRKGPKVYFGEYAANGIKNPRKRLEDNGNYFETALAEAAFLTGVEKNGDIVEMTSYAPLLNLVGSDRWRHNLIDFNPKTICKTANYFVQKLFASNFGSRYIPCDVDGEGKDGVFVSCVEGDETNLRIVNTNENPIEISIDVGCEIKSAFATIVSGSGGLFSKNRLNFVGQPENVVSDEIQKLDFENCTIKFTAEPQSITNIAMR